MVKAVLVRFGPKGMKFVLSLLQKPGKTGKKDRKTDRQKDRETEIEKG
jgi:hypothetical protein